MKIRIFSLAFALAVVLTGVSHAELIDRGNGMIYDTDLNITWLQDAEYASTSGYSPTLEMTWSDSMTWVANLNYQGITGWRLPTTPLGTLTPDYDYWREMIGELGHLFYIEGITGASPGPFNIPIYSGGWTTGGEYWTSTAGPINMFGYPTAVQVWFEPTPGDFLLDLNDRLAIAWAVHDGDVGATVPEADLFGTWYFQVFLDSPSANNPYWGYGTMILDSTGAVTGGTAVNSFGETETLTGGSFTIDSAGQVAGSITESDGYMHSLPHGKLDAGKTILTMVNSDLNYRGLFVAAKGGGGLHPSRPCRYVVFPGLFG